MLETSASLTGVERTLSCIDQALVESGDFGKESVALRLRSFATIRFELASTLASSSAVVQSVCRDTM